MGRRPTGGLVTRRELAVVHGVHPQTITKWEREGLQPKERGRRGVPSRYDLDDVRAWLDARETAALADAPVDLIRERARKERAQAMLAEQKFAMLEGQLLPADEVAEVWGAHVAAVRAKLLSWPQALADRLNRAAARGGVSAIERELDDAVREVLVELAEGELEPSPKAVRRRSPTKKKPTKKKPIKKRPAKKKTAKKKAARRKAPKK